MTRWGQTGLLARHEVMIARRPMPEHAYLPILLACCQCHHLSEHGIHSCAMQVSATHLTTVQWHAMLRQPFTSTMTTVWLARRCACVKRCLSQAAPIVCLLVPQADVKAVGAGKRRSPAWLQGSSDHQHVKQDEWLHIIPVHVVDWISVLPSCLVLGSQQG